MPKPELEPEPGLETDPDGDDETEPSPRGRTGPLGSQPRRARGLRGEPGDFTGQLTWLRRRGSEIPVRVVRIYCTVADVRLPSGQMKCVRRELLRARSAEEEEGETPMRPWGSVQRRALGLHGEPGDHTEQPTWLRNGGSEIRVCVVRIYWSMADVRLPNGRLVYVSQELLRARDCDEEEVSPPPSQQPGRPEEPGAGSAAGSRGS